MAYSESILIPAEEALAQAQRAHRQAQEKRRAEIYRTLPRTAEIDQLLRQTAPRILAASLRQGLGGQEALAALRAENLALQEEEAALLGLSPGEHRFYRGAGCSECFGTGYRGRTGVFEILTMTPAIRRAIHRQDLGELEAAVAQSTFRPILENCAQLVTEGVTSLEEVIRIVGRHGL